MQVLNYFPLYSGSPHCRTLQYSNTLCLSANPLLSQKSQNYTRPTNPISLNYYNLATNTPIDLPLLCYFHKNSHGHHYGRHDNLTVHEVCWSTSQGQTGHQLAWLLGMRIDHGLLLYTKLIHTALYSSLYTKQIQSCGTSYPGKLNNWQ